MSNDVEALTEQRAGDVVNLALFGNTTAMMMTFCECSPGGANTSSAHCRLLNDYNITLLEVCNDQRSLQQVGVTQVRVSGCS